MVDSTYMDHEVIEAIELVTDMLPEARQRFAVAAALLDVLAQSDPDELTSTIAHWITVANQPAEDPDDNQFQETKNCINRALTAIVLPPGRLRLVD